MVYARGIIKIRHRKVEFITGMKTKSVVGRSKKRPVIGYHLWIAPNQDSSFETNIFDIHFIKYLHLAYIIIFHHFCMWQVGRGG